MPVILGQPWQRTYKGVPNWRREGINFEYDHARFFTPFLKDEDFATDTESEAEEDFPKQNEPTTTTLKKEESCQKEIPTEARQQKEEAKQKGTPINAKETNRLHNIWVPKKMVQAQQGSTQIWVPKGAVRETYNPKPRI